MAKWNYTITGLRKFLNPDATDAEANKGAKEIAAHLRTYDCINALDFSGDLALDELEASENLEDVNVWLNHFWNVCDDHRIWVDLDLKKVS
jgi:hypothetical protein